MLKVTQQGVFQGHFQISSFMRNSVLGVWEAFILLCALWRNISRKITCVPERTGRRSKSGMYRTHVPADRLNAVHSGDLLTNSHCARDPRVTHRGSGSHLGTRSWFIEFRSSTHLNVTIRSTRRSSQRSYCESIKFAAGIQPDL